MNRSSWCNRAALGAKVIEKHVTLNTKMLGPDHAASLNFDICKDGRTIRRFILV